jgi:hypothetical protein
VLIVLTLGCYAVGAGFALFATRNGTPPWWGRFVRAQFLVAGATLSVTAGWRFRVGEQLLEAVFVAAVLYLITAVTVITRAQGGRRRSTGECVLEAWATNPNTGYWIIPIATLLVGPAGTIVAVLVDQLLIPIFIWWVSRLRRDAPIQQQARTRIFDYAGPIGFGTGLLIAQFVDAPSWTSDVLRFFGIFMAFIGAAMWAGSVRHTLAKLDSPTAEGWRRFLMLTAVRVACYLAIAAAFWGTPGAPIALLAAFTIPTFFPANASVLYGYHSDVVGIASRWGWVLLPVGVGAAWLAS